MIEISALSTRRSDRGDSITLAYKGINIRLLVKKRSDWNVLGHLILEAMLQKGQDLHLLQTLFAQSPELVIGYTLWAITNRHRPEDKRLRISIDRRLKIGRTNEEKDRYAFQLTAALLYGYLDHLKPAWRGPVPGYLEKFREELHGGGFKAFARPWGSRAVRVCMKQVDPARVKRVSTASFARKYCYPKREFFAIWLRVLHQEIEGAENGKMVADQSFLPDGGPKAEEALKELKKGSAVQVFVALFCLAWKYPTDAITLGRLDPDVADMNARVRAFLREKVRGVLSKG